MSVSRNGIFNIIFRRVVQVFAFVSGPLGKNLKNSRTFRRHILLIHRRLRKVSHPFVNKRDLSVVCNREPITPVNRNTATSLRAFT